MFYYAELHDLRTTQYALFLRIIAHYPPRLSIISTDYFR